MSRYPIALDDDTNLPNPAGYRQDGTRAADGTFLAAAVHSTLIRVLQLGAQALQRKLGTGDSTPALDRVLVGTGPGLSEWRALTAFAVTRFGVGAGTAGQALVVDGTGQALTFGDGFATDTDLSAHTADTTAVHGIADTAALVLTGDVRLTDQRVPTDGSVTNAKVSATAAIAESKLSLASDAAATTASRRTLGTGALQAAPGSHVGETGAGKHVAQQSAIANLAQTISNPPTQAEVQAISSKVDAILGALRAAGVLAP